MADVRFPRLRGESLEDVLDLIAKLRRQYTFILENLDDTNIASLSVSKLDATLAKITTAMIEELEVGKNVIMGENAYLSWAHVTDQPDIEQMALDKINATYIDANGVWTPHVYATHLNTLYGKIGTAQIDQLIVGDNVTMGPNARLSWANVDDQPFIPSTAADVGAVAANQLAVFNTLTNSGALRGLFMENGELYMNADFIHTGTLVAGRIPTLDDTKIASAATWNAVGPGIRSDLHLTATLPNAITMNALGIKATTTDGKWACLNSNGLEVYNGAIVVRNQAGQTVLDGNGIVTEGLGATKIYKPGQTGNYATIGGSYGDFNLYHNNQASPWFYIQDSGPYPGPAGMFVCGTNGFLNFSQSITEPYGTWDFTHCTPQNLNVVAKFA